MSRERLEELAALPRSRHTPLSGPILPVPTNPAIEEILSEGDGKSPGRNYFMKAAYYRPGQDKDGWWRRGWISDRERPPYAIGDLIVLYLGGDGSPHCCPAILEVRAIARDDADFVEQHGRGAVDRKYPFVTETRSVFDIPIEGAPRPEVFGIDSRSTQYGYRRLRRDQFTDAVNTMTSR